MKLTQELIDKIQEAMLHTNLKGEINWKDGDDIEVQIAGTFAKDKFIVLKNATKNPFENAQPHPHFDYEKRVFTKDGREEFMKEQKMHMMELHICSLTSEFQAKEVLENILMNIEALLKVVKLWKGFKQQVIIKILFN